MQNKYSKNTRELVNALSSTGHPFPYSCDSTNRHCNKIYACTLPHNIYFIVQIKAYICQFITSLILTDSMRSNPWDVN